MTEKLVERLRFGCPLDKPLGDFDVKRFERTALEAADRIEQLERDLAEAIRSANRGPGDVEIRLNPDGTLDEVCAPGVHLEQMSANGWFLSVGEVNLWLNAKGKITVTYEDNRDAARKEG